MRTTLLAAALIGAASADLHIPADILRRDDNSGNLIHRDDPTSVDTASCSSLASSFNSALPPGPTVFPEFSSNYYKTVSRTATATESDCAWMTELPGSTYQEYRVWNTRAKAFRDDPANARFQAIWEECADVFENDDYEYPCSSEWLSYIDRLIDDGGLFTDEDATTTTSTSPTDSPESTDAPGGADAPETPNESGDDGSGASTVAAKTYAAAALLAAIVGAAALL